jgi:hypothetical protein
VVVLLLLAAVLVAAHNHAKPSASEIEDGLQVSSHLTRIRAPWEV